MHGGLSDGSGRLKHGRYRKGNTQMLGDILLQNNLKDIFRAKKLLEPYLDEQTRAGLERAIEKYAEVDQPFKALFLQQR
jgi:hypothetical protein